MDTSFIGRSAERSFLEQSYADVTSAFVPVYGRRRIGKSRLIVEFLKTKPAIYYVGKRSPAGLQIKEFLVESAQVLDQPLLAEVAADNWRTAFISVWEQWKRPDKLVIALDEFQWIAQTSPEIISVLQELWDRRWRDAGNVFLILCGSYMGFMEKEVLGRESPLFGRRTGQILLKPFNYREAAQFHPRYSIVDQAKVWFLCGGIPLYLRLLSQQHSVEMNIRDLYLEETAPLFREADFLLREELREVETYYAVLMAIAAGATTSAEIARRSLVDAKVLGYYLNNLISLGYVAKRFPLIGPRPPVRRVRYCIADPLLRFWSRFVYPHTSYMVLHGPHAAFDHNIRPSLDQYFGQCFESLCREGLVFLYAQEGVHANFTIGEYWDKHVQIDIVGYRSDNMTDIAECKWSSSPDLTGALNEVVGKIPLYPNQRNATIYPRLFLRNRPKRIPANTSVTIHALEDLYK